MDASFNAGPGTRIMLSHGGIPAEYTVTGTVAPAEGKNPGPAVFLSAPGAADLWPHGGSVATIGILAEPGVSPEQLRRGHRSRGIRRRQLHGRPAR